MEAQQAQLAEAHQQWRLQAELNGRAERRYNEGLEDFARLSEVTASAAAAWSPHLQSGAPQQPPAVPQHAQLLQQQQQQMQQLQQLHQQSQQQQPQQQPLHHQQPQQQPQQPPPPPQQQPPPPQPQQHDGGAVSIHGVADRTADAAVGASGPASGGTSSPPGPQPGQGAQQPQHAGAVLLEMLKGQSGGPCDGKPLQGAPGDGEELDEIDQMLRSCAVAHLDGDPGGDPWRHLGPQRAGPQAHPRAQAQPPPSQPQQGFQPPPPSAPAPPAPGRPRAPPSHQAGRQATGPGVAPLQPAAAPSPPLGGPQHAPPPPSAAAPPRGAPSAQPLSQQAPPLQQPAAAHAPQRTGGDATRSFEQDPRWTQQRHYAEDPRQQKPPQQPQPPPQRPVHAAADGRRPEEAGRGQRPAAGERQDHHREGSPEQPLALDGGPELWRGAGRAQSSQLAQEVLEKFFKPWCMQRATQLFRFAHRHFTEGKERGGVVFRFQHTGEVAGGRWMPDEHSWSYQSQRSIGGLGIKTNHVLSAVQRYSPQQQCVVVVLVTEPRFDRFYILNAPKPQPGGGRAGADARSRAEWYGGNH